MTAARLRAWASGALVLMFALLAWRFASFLNLGWNAVRWPFEIDYAEGIVWQQAEMIFSRGAYGAIDGFPTIVFHYTPLFHGLVSALSVVTGWDMLYTGRGISIAATLAVAALAGTITARAAPAQVTGRGRGRLMMVAGSGLALFASYPVVLSGLVMRVDILAVVFSLSGLWLGLKAYQRPGLIHGAALCFVAAVFTKQSVIAAPAALFGVMLLLRPRLALTGIATCIVAGLAALLSLNMLTDGGFVRHIFLYNINRIDWGRLLLVPRIAAMHTPLIAAALLAVFFRSVEMRTRRYGQPWRSIADHGDDLAWLTILAYLLTTSLTLITVAKVGSFINYLIEWIIVIAMIAGCGLASAVRAVQQKTESDAPDMRAVLGAVVIPVMIGVHALKFQGPDIASKWTADKFTAMQALSARVRAADKPIISDEMVLVRRSGKQVVWEPMIFVELASTGIWDERSFVQRIRNQEFAMFITTTSEHDWSPAVRSAMEAAYPVQDRVNHYTVRLPKGEK
jgi:hypothetical protein